MITAIVLAAGFGRRFGAQKLLVPLAGRPVIRRTVERVMESAIDHVVVVVGPDADAVRVALSGLDVRLVVNPHADTGMASSLVAGVASLDPPLARGGAHTDAARSRGSDAVVVALGDQPAVAPEIIDRLIATWRRSGQPIVVPVYQGVRGNPVLFDLSLREELLAVQGDRGARDVIARDPARAASVEIAAPMPTDLDEPDQLDAVRREWEASRDLRARTAPGSPRTPPCRS